MHPHTCIRTHTCTHAHIHACTHARARTHAACTYLHGERDRKKNTHTQTETHTRTHVLFWGCIEREREEREEKVPFLLSQVLTRTQLIYVAACCSVLQCDAMCCRVLQSVAFYKYG